MIHAVFHHLQNRHGNLIINISGHLRIRTGNFYSKFLLQFPAHYLCQAIHLRQKCLKIRIGNPLFSLSGIGNLIAWALRLILTIHMRKEILDAAHHCPSEIRYLVIRFQTAQLPLQKAGNHTQKLQNRLQILLRRRGFLPQVGK